MNPTRQTSRAPPYGGGHGAPARSHIAPGNLALAGVSIPWQCGVRELLDVDPRPDLRGDLKRPSAGEVAVVTWNVNYSA
jgi:hypothetical protein